ncbi:hypothetical protein ACFLSY_00870 [Bacteroidota bacterium]
MFKKIFEKRIWKRLYTERLGEPILYNLISIFILLFGNIVKKIKYDLVPRMPYSFGLDLSYKTAISLKNKLIVNKLIFIEFGVASGAGLFNMADTAKKLSVYYNIETEIIGFDSMDGMPKPVDYRGHPEKYLDGDFIPIDIEKLKSRLPINVKLYTNDLKKSIKEFQKTLSEGDFIAFISFDLDYWSSTVEAFEIFKLPCNYFLPKTILYFDDIQDIDDHNHAGEFLAIKEYNHNNDLQKINKINNLRYQRIFKNQVWIEQMYWHIDFSNPFFSRDFHKDRKRVRLTNPYL